MKKSRFTLMFLLLSFLLGGLTSCQVDEENDVLPMEELTAADIFVASEKFQNYLKARRKDSKKMDKIFSGLTSEEQDEYNRLRYLIPENEDEFNEIAQAINVIIGIDYKSRLMELAELQQNTFQDTNFTSLELLQALQRYNVFQSTIPQTRGYEERVMECRRACDNAGFNFCPSAKNPWDKDYDPDAYSKMMECLWAAAEKRDSCYANCG